MSPRPGGVEPNAAARDLGGSGLQTLEPGTSAVETQDRRSRACGRSPLATRARTASALVAGSVLFLAPPAQAQNVEGLLQNVVDLLTGNAARLLAIIAVVVVGILWMFGLFDLRRAATVILGIVVVFGAAEIVTALTGGAQ
jgi:type IV secretion system protein VirB2